MDFVSIFRENEGIAAFVAVIFLWRHVQALHKSCEADRQKLWDILNENNLTNSGDSDS